MSHPYRLGVMLGDGIGPEIVPASVRVVDAALAAAGADTVAWHQLPLGASAIEEHGSAIPAATLEAGCSGRTTAPPIPSRSGRS
jgi:3-isopropylmalate dehydrogenase